jgi:hypothetical protein
MPNPRIDDDYEDEECWVWTVKARRWPPQWVKKHATIIMNGTV